MLPCPRRANSSCALTSPLSPSPADGPHRVRNSRNQNAMLALVEEVLQAGQTAGFSRTRVVAHMEWALGDFPGVDDVVEYETRLNQVLPRYPDPVVCVYDSSRFGAGVALDILRTHSMVILGVRFKSIRSLSHRRSSSVNFDSEIVRA
jgi:hypothetical protein